MTDRPPHSHMSTSLEMFDLVPMIGATLIHSEPGHIWDKKGYRVGDNSGVSSDHDESGQIGPRLNHEFVLNLINICPEAEHLNLS